MSYLRDATIKAGHDDYKLSPVDVALIASGHLGAAWVASKVAQNVHLPGTQLRNLQYLNKQTLFDQPLSAALGRSLDKPYTAADLMMNTVKAAEEQLMKIPRAFSGFSLLSSSYIHNQIKDRDFLLTEEMLTGQNSYLKRISKGAITDADIRSGLTLRGGKLYSNRTGKSVLGYARLTTNFWNKSAGKAAGANYRFTQALFHEFGLNGTSSDTIITGGSNYLQALKQKAIGVARVGFENYLKLANDPFEAVLNPIEKMVGSASWAPKALRKGSKFWNRVGLRNLFGAGTWKEMVKAGSTSSLIGKYAMRSLPLLGIGMWAAKAFDEKLHDIPVIKDTVLGTGVKGMIATAYQDISMGYSVLSKMTGLTALAKKQDELAPGSTSLLGLGAFPASLGIAGTTIGGIQNLLEHTPPGMKVQAPQMYVGIATKLENTKGIVGKVASALKLTNKSRVGAYGMIGVLAGALAVAPFIPGALGSTTDPSELRAQYEGKQLVPVREGQYWSMGNTPYEGGDIKYFAPHWTVRATTDASKKGKLGEFYGKPLSRLAMGLIDRYYKERSMDADRPYTYWGASDFGLGFVENLIQPFKELIKPTLLAHPESADTIGPDRLQRAGRPTPNTVAGTDMGASTRNYLSEVAAPDNAASWLRNTTTSFIDTLGLVGFAFGNTANKITGGQGFLNVDAQHESSGRIWSAERAYWDQELGDLGLTNEFYRRLNPKREYGPEYVNSSIRNSQADWMPDTYKYGDPYCVTPDTLIEVDELDFKEAGNVTDDIITTHTGQHMQIAARFDRAIDAGENVHKISVTSLSAVEMKMSEEHPILSAQYDKANKVFTQSQWIEVQDLDTKHFAMYPRPVFAETTSSLKLADYLLESVHTDRWCYKMRSGEKDTYVAYEYMEDTNRKTFVRGELKQILQALRCRRSNFETAQNMHKHNKKILRVPETVELTENIGYLAGLYLAEGIHERSVLRFALHASELSLLKKAYSGALEIDPFATMDFNHIENTNGAYGYIYSSIVADLVLSLFGKKSHNKSIPNQVLYWPKNVIAALIDGYHDGDGCLFDVRKSPTRTLKQASFKSVNKKLLLQIRKLLLGFGILSSLVQSAPATSVMKSTGQHVNSGISFNLVLRGQNAENLTNLKSGKTIEPYVYVRDSYIDDDYIYLRIRSNIIVEDERIVIGYEVDVDDSFCIAGVATHNTKQQLGELRVAGRGYEVLHPELEGVNFEDYPAIHRMNILQSVSPRSIEYYRSWADVRNQIAAGNATSDTEEMYNELMRQREMKLEEEEYGNYDYGDNPLGSYYLSLKKFGHALPTESLFPIAPIHKFSGPVDPVTHYKSYNVLDSSFKVWERPMSDYVKPAYNKVMDIVVGGEFKPKEYKEKYKIEDYFDRLQHSKNQLLSAQSSVAANMGNYELAAYISSGKRSTPYDTSKYDDLGTLSRQLMPKEQTVFKAMSEEMDSGLRNRMQKIASPTMKSMLESQWQQKEMMYSGQFEQLAELANKKETIMQAPSDVMSDMPNRDFVGWAPGVDLNAVKVKALNNLGKNIRDHNLWKEDERQARVLDTINAGRTLSNPVNDYYNDNRDDKKSAVHAYALSMGIRDANITATPKYGPTTVEYHGKEDSKAHLRRVMRKENMIVY